MDKLDEIDFLRFQNLSLRQELLNRERDAMATALCEKYGKPGARGVQVSPDGTVIHAPEGPATP